MNTYYMMHIASNGVSNLYDFATGLDSAASTIQTAGILSEDTTLFVGAITYHKTSVNNRYIAFIQVTTDAVASGYNLYRV
jgi:hypothetical protein